MNSRDSAIAENLADLEKLSRVNVGGPVFNGGMETTAAVLDRVVADLDLLLSDDALGCLTDSERLGVLAQAGEVQRRVEAVIVETVATADAPTLPAAGGCRSMNELLQRALRADARTAAQIAKAGRAVSRDREITSGEWMPARWPALRQAMLHGDLGVAGLLSAIGPIEQAGDRIGAAARWQADAVLADMARGVSDGVSDATPPAIAEDLKVLAQAIAMRLDPDGSEPTEERARQRRGVTIGRVQDGVYPIRGNLLPEVYAQLQLIFDALLNPKVDGPADLRVAFRFSDEHDGADDDFNSDPRKVIDPRTTPQRQHDALATALGIAARHDEMPHLGGAAPTLVVQVTASDLTAGAGWATIPGVEAPVSASVAAHTGCSGTIQRVLTDEGRIAGIVVSDRVFTAYQRRAIVLRDQECLIPGCHVRASWCEIHHVMEHARGGPTHTDNGVPLCWWHHRTLDTSGWQIRMQSGLPEIRGPAWWDPERRWRTPRLSRERALQRE